MTRVTHLHVARMLNAMMALVLVYRTISETLTPTVVQNVQ